MAVNQNIMAKWFESAQWRRRRGHRQWSAMLNSEPAQARRPQGGGGAARAAGDGG